MKKILFAMSILFVAACGGGSKGETMDPCKEGKMAHMDCEGMADNVAKSMSEAPDMTEDAIAQARGIMLDQCTSMAWSQESIDCMAMATGPEEGEKCADMLTEEQKSSFMEAMNGPMDGGGDDGMEYDEGEDGMD